MTALPRQDALFVEPDADLEADLSAPPEPKKPRPVQQKSKPELEREGVKAIYLRRTGRKYMGQAADHGAWTALKEVATSIGEIEARWDFSLSLPAKDWAHAPTIWQLKQKWNDIGTRMPRAAADVALPDCEACGVSGRTHQRVYRMWMCTPCSTLADDVAAKVPQPSPRITRLGDPRIVEFQAARDLAVSEWARSRPQAKGVAT